MRRLVALLIVLLCIVVMIPFVYTFGKKYIERNTVYPTYHPIIVNTAQPIMPSATATDSALPPVHIIPMKGHVFQTFNNCGPATLSMALSYFGITKSQEELGGALRPYQVKNGDNDDKSTSLDELASKAEEFNLLAYHRPAGDSQRLKQFIAYDMPVVTVTWLKPNEDIGHYRLLRGYDDTQKVYIQDDSFQGKNLTYTYDEFNAIWEKFSYEYLVLVPKEKRSIAETILADDLDEKSAWRHGVELSTQQLEHDPGNIGYRFNLSVAYYHISEYQKSINEFEKIENKLPFRTLWYQIEPIKSYFELGKYDRVLAISESILNNHNKAFSELYFLRGQVYEKQGKKDLAKQEYEKAVFYNIHYLPAQRALDFLK